MLVLLVLSCDLPIRPFHGDVVMITVSSGGHHAILAGGLGRVHRAVCPLDGALLRIVGGDLGDAGAESDQQFVVVVG